jgi:hypothetical protein
VGRDGGGIGGDRARATRIAFYGATYRLLPAGSFAYRGEVHAAEPSPFRPGERMAGDATVEGTVVLEHGLTRDIAVDASGRAVETVTSGPKFWTRRASTVDGLGTAPWAVRTSDFMVAVDPYVGRPLPLLGTAAITYLLLSARDPRPVAPDPAGRCVIRASMPAVDRRDPYADLSVGVDLLITLDGDGNLARIVVRSAPDDPEFVLELEITQIGEPQAIAPPDSGTLARVEESHRRTEGGRGAPGRTRTARSLTSPQIARSGAHRRAYSGRSALPRHYFTHAPAARQTPGVISSMPISRYPAGSASAVRGW